MALKHDSGAVVCCQPQGERLVVRSRVWRPDDDRIDVAAVENHLRALHRDLDVREIAYDPAYFERSAQALVDEGLPMVEFPQSPQRMVPACQHAYEAIVSGRVAHDGDPTLRDHVESAAQREGERGWTLSKGKSKRKIDACIAMVIACYEATGLQEPGSPDPFVLFG
jgi:phage terminase large subunit-like protein